MSLTYTESPKEEALSPEILEHFENWLEDQSYFSNYEKYKILRNEILIRVYRYVPELAEGEDYLLDEHNIPYVAQKELMLPIAKVIAAGPKCEYGLEPGDLVTLPDNLLVKMYNPSYLEWAERQDERPLKKGEHPPVYIYGLEKWSHMIFIGDKIAGHNEEDLVTFLLPENFIRTGLSFKS